MISAQAYDAAGNTSSASAQVSIKDVTDPSVRFAQPAPGSVTADSVPITLIASDLTGIKRLVLSREMSPVATETDSSFLYYTWDATAEAREVIAEKTGEIRDVVVEKASEAWGTATGSSSEDKAAEAAQGSEDETDEYPAFGAGGDEES